MNDQITPAQKFACEFRKSFKSTYFVNILNGSF